MSRSSPCTGSPCESFRLGHNVHWIQATHAGREPATWRWGVVTAVGEGGYVATVRYPSGQEAELWRHAALPLGSHLLGCAVCTSEHWSLLEVAGTWISVHVLDGSTPVRPVDAAGSEAEGAITDVRLGIAEPTARAKERCTR
jgi:hypothetical protein